MVADEWNDFLIALAVVGATLLAVELQALESQAQNQSRSALKQATALLAVVQLAAPVLFGLTALMPVHPWNVAGAIAGLAGYAAVSNQVVQYVRHPGKVDTADVLQLWLIIVNIAAFSILVWVPSPAWKAATCVFLITSSLIEFCSLRRAEMADTEAPASDATLSR